MDGSWGDVLGPVMHKVTASVKATWVSQNPPWSCHKGVIQHDSACHGAHVLVLLRPPKHNPLRLWTMFTHQYAEFRRVTQTRHLVCACNLGVLKHSVVQS